MRLVIDLPEDELATAETLRRRLLDPDGELQLQGFRALVVREMPETALVVVIPLTDRMRSPEDLGLALRQIAAKVQGGTGNGKVRNLYGDFAGDFDITGPADLPDTPVTRRVDEFLDHPETGTRRTRPAR